VFQRDKGMTLSKRDKASRKKRDKIIQTTINLLLKKGSLTSTTDICAAAKITRPTLYHYFGSKRNLLFSVHMESIERDLKPLLSEAAAISDPLKRLTYMIRTHVRNICLHPELRVIIHDTLTTRDKYFREVKEEWKKHYILIRDTVSELKSKDIVCTDLKPSLSALLVLGMMTWVTYWFDYSRKEDIEKVVDAALQQVLNGLGLKSEYKA
jgi:TetR/AcrR family transcriptional regulator, cholesterol catabolism regulator